MSAGLLLSGGLDSSALAFWQRPPVCLTVDYGQLPAAAEISAAGAIAARIGASFEVIRVDCRSLGSGDLASAPSMEGSPTPEWWPFRNQLLITLCAMRSLHLGIDHLLLGTVRSDSVHRDGTADFLAAIDRTLACQEGGLRAIAPALTMTSLDLISISGIPIDALPSTHSCHTGTLHCGRCRGCQRRFSTFQSLGLESS